MTKLGSTQVPTGRYPASRNGRSYLPRASQGSPLGDDVHRARSSYDPCGECDKGQCDECDTCVWLRELA